MCVSGKLNNKKDKLKKHRFTYYIRYLCSKQTSQQHRYLSAPFGLLMHVLLEPLFTFVASWRQCMGYFVFRSNPNNIIYCVVLILRRKTEYPIDNNIDR